MHAPCQMVQMLISKKNRREVYKYLFKGEQSAWQSGSSSLTCSTCQQQQQQRSLGWMRCWLAAALIAARTCQQL